MDIAHTFCSATEEMADISELLKKPSFLIKFLQVILAVVGVALHQDSIYSTGINGSVNVGLLADKNKIAFVYMVFCGFLLSTMMNIIGKVLGGIPKKLTMLWAVVGCILWVAAGAVILKAYADVEEMLPSTPIKLPPELEKLLNEELAAGIIGILNGLLYLVEFILVAKFETEELSS
ncbi:hypothetical protein J437_LFUL001232 [Ladona fulva]|uniref:Uncharacterized protein n=1 Tax=Ladona fulva TaxID=123851 RepID=A0A8K0NXG6_LADFU|nr:hypothetical protein J437_LFUL001232 [Ladona fulva]